MRALFAAAPALGLALLVGCGGTNQSQGPAEPPGQPAPAPTERQSVTEVRAEVGELEAELARSEATLHDALGQQMAALAPTSGEVGRGAVAPGATPDSEAPPSAIPAPAPAPPPPPADRDADVEDTEAQAQQSSAGCDTACRAYASMERAARRICELAGATHRRCTNARKRLAKSRTRLERAGCGCV